jgi:hypothetical protein
MHLMLSFLQTRHASAQTAASLRLMCGQTTPTGNIARVLSDNSRDKAPLILNIPGCGRRIAA